MDVILTKVKIKGTYKKKIRTLGITQDMDTQMKLLLTHVYPMFICTGLPIFLIRRE